MTHSYTIAVLGPIPRDHITTYEGHTVEKYGGVLYPVAALSALMNGQGQVVPVVHVRTTDKEPINTILDEIPGVETRHVTDGADQGDVIALRYVDQNKRLETQTAFMDPIVPDDVQDLMHADAFVLVPVTDFEIALDTLRHIKTHSDALLIFDAHGPTNTCTRYGERHLQFWIDRDRWLPHIDILKMNLEEARCSWFENEYQPDEFGDPDQEEMPLDELPRFAEHCLNMGVKALYVTLDEYGCAVYFKNAAGKIEEHFVKRIQVEHVVDTTGCGDSFAGGLAFGYLKTGDYLQACQYGNAMGAQRCTGTALAIYKPLAETEAQIADTYGV